MARNMRIAVTGSNGQLTKSLQALSSDVLSIYPIGRPHFDMLSPDAISGILDDLKPDILVSAAAYTQVDKAETDVDLAFQINHLAPKVLAVETAKRSIPIIHISTDYVFDGEKPQPYVEEDQPNPQTVYGKSKLAGEQAVAEANPAHVILRTSWVYSIYGHNFVKTMLRLAEYRDTVSVVADQFGSPTSAHDLSEAIVCVAKTFFGGEGASLSGLFHLSGSGSASWADLAEEVFRCREILTSNATSVAPITSADYPTTAKRPKNSRLNTEKFRHAYGYEMPDWRVSVDEVVRTIKSEGGL